MTSPNKPDLEWLEFDLKVACRITGLARAAFLQAAAIAPSQLKVADNKVVSRKIWETAEQLTGRREIGLEVLDDLQLDDFGDLGLAVITANDFQSAIQNLATLSGTLSRRWKYEFVDHPRYPAVVIEKTEEEHRYPHHSVDSNVAIGVFLARALLGKSHYDIYRANFRHPDFGVGNIYEERLACRCRFNQPVDGVEFSVGSLSHPMPLRNKPMHDALLTQLHHRLAIKDDVKAKVRKVVFELLQQQLWPNRQRVANLLCVSERTLVRQLQQAEATFRDLQEAVLEKETRRLLVAGLSAEQIAEKLGYSGSSPLARMMKRRTGKKLSELRDTPEP